MNTTHVETAVTNSSTLETAVTNATVALVECLRGGTLSRHQCVCRVFPNDDDCLASNSTSGNAPPQSEHLVPIKGGDGVTVWSNGKQETESVITYLVLTAGLIWFLLMLFGAILVVYRRLRNDALHSVVRRSRAGPQPDTLVLPPSYTQAEHLNDVLPSYSQACLKETEARQTVAGAPVIEALVEEPEDWEVYQHSDFVAPDNASCASVEDDGEREAARVETLNRHNEETAAAAAEGTFATPPDSQAVTSGTETVPTDGKEGGINGETDDVEEVASVKTYKSEDGNTQANSSAALQDPNCADENCDERPTLSD